MKSKFVFGPVSSRRLGQSLGIDIIPHKTCSLDCIYCECGKTTNLTTERKEYFPIESIIDDIDTFIKNSMTNNINYITFAGSGEPTLHSKIGEIVQHLKKNYPYKIALITNSTLLHLPNISHELSQVDLIIPSIDSTLDNSFKKINRPDYRINLNKMIDGIIKFRESFKGEFWPEVFIVPGINDSPQEIIKIKEILLKLRPNKIQLNTIDRPGTLDSVKKASIDDLIKVKELLLPLQSEIIIKNNKSKTNETLNLNIKNQIIETLKRRPSTQNDILENFSIDSAELDQFITELQIRKILKQKNETRGNFFFIPQK